MKKTPRNILIAVGILLIGGSFGTLAYQNAKSQEKITQLEKKQHTETSTEKVVSDAETHELRTYFSHYYKEMSTLDKEKIQAFSTRYFNKEFLKTMDVNGFIKGLQDLTATYKAKTVAYTGEVIGATTLEDVFYVAIREYVSLDGKEKQETGIGLYTLEKKGDTYKILDISIDDTISHEFSNTLEENGVKVQVKKDNH